MQCLYCDRRLGLFSSAKGAFCSDEHEQLYRSAAQKRLEAPYVSSAGALDNSHAQDLTQLLQATQIESGATVQAPAEVARATEVNEAVAVSVVNSSASSDAHAVPEIGQAAFGTPVAPAASGSEQTQPLPNLSDKPDPQWSLISDPPAVEPEIPTDRRTEPRIKDIKILKVAALRDPEKQVNCALVDTSDTGIQFTSDSEFRTGEILIVELPDQLALAEVRYSQMKDGRYAVGAERAQTISSDAASSAGTGQERAELLIKALCDRVKTGFADEPGQGMDRTSALERVARILEIWQSTQSAPAPSTSETHIEAKPSTGVGRAFGAVAVALVMAGLLTVCVLQFQKDRTPLPPPPRVAAPPPLAKIEPKVEAKVEPKPEIKTEVKVEPKVQPKVAPKVEAKAEPKVAPPPVPAASGRHRAQIRAVQPTWVGISTDGKKVFAGMLAKGETHDLEYSKFAFLHTGNAVGVEIIVDGQSVPMGKPGLRLVELNTTGYQFLRWSNDDPAHP